MHTVRIDTGDGSIEFVVSKLDASESIFVARELELIRPNAYEVKYPQLLGRTFVPVDHSVDPGAETVTIQVFDRFGLARIIANYADDLPRADVKVTEASSKVKGLGSSYGYSVQEIRAAKFAGKSLDQRKANSAHWAIDELIDRLSQTGDSANGLLGLLNQSNTTAFTVSTGVGGLLTWVSKTPDEIAADMHGIANNIVSSTKGVEIPDTLLLPLAQYNLVATTRMGDGSDQTILSFFLSTSPYIKNVKQWFALTGAGSGATDRMVCYRNDPDALQLIIPMEFMQHAPEQEGLEIVTACEARCGGVVVYYPLSMSYGDGI